MSGQGELTDQIEEQVTGQVRDKTSDKEDSREQPKKSQVSDTAEEQTIRRSERSRTLTEKGRGMQEEKIKALQDKFRYMYGRWRNHVKYSKKTLSEATDRVSDDMLNHVICEVHGLSADVQCVYNELRTIETPDQETHQKVDLCVHVSQFIIDRASRQLGRLTPGEEDDWPEAGSLFNSSISSFISDSRRTSLHTSGSTERRQEAAADAAASQAVLKVSQEQEREQRVIQ